MTTQPAAPPTQEIGYVVQPTPDWSFFSAGVMDQTEEVPELSWPDNIRTYHKMRTDPQIDALIKSITLPPGKLKYKLAPNGAKDEVVADISNQLQLPIQGDTEDIIINPRRFNHREHMRMAFKAATTYGHMPFEMVGHIDPDDLRWMLDKLSPRLPQTIARFLVQKNGDLAGLIQYGAAQQGVYRDINTGGRRGINATGPQSALFAQGIPIPISNLAFYCWDREGGNWAGRSMLRPLYKSWLLKDRLIRIDAIKNDRFGAGIPTGTAPQGGDPTDYQKMASAIRATENGGAGLANGASLDILGIKGTLPDTIGSIRYHDEAMARSFLAMFLQLGQTETGSRALGDSFIDFFQDALWSFVDWYLTNTNLYVVRDIVDWNYGEDEQAPLIVAEEDPDRPLDGTVLAELVRAGALLVDEELQNWIRSWYNMPKYTGAPPLPSKPGDVSQDQTTTTPAPAKAKAGRRQQAMAQHRERIVVQDTHGDRHDEPTAQPDVPEQEVSGSVLPGPTNAPVPQATDAGGHVRIIDPRRVHARAQTLERPATGHREPNDIEVRAGTDFDKIQKAWKTATTSLVDKWKSTIKPKQVDALLKELRDAIKNEDWAKLGAPEIESIGDDLIMEHMIDAASSSIEAAIAEAASQGVTLPPLEAVDLASNLQYRATAVANQMGRALSDSAGRMALQAFAPDVPEDVVIGSVEDGLTALSDSFLNDMLGGVLTAAQNVARAAVFDSGDGPKPTVYASELLDENTCGPCADNDEHEYDNVTDAAIDYPAGGYAECEGGPRCRGTLVAVYPEGEN